MVLLLQHVNVRDKILRALHVDAQARGCGLNDIE